MQVAMYKLIKLYTCRTSTTRIAILSTAQQVICKGYRYRKFSVTLRTGNEQGMRQAILVNTTTQLPYNILLPYYIFEKNAHQ
jgi:hypothetical protein